MLLGKSPTISGVIVVPPVIVERPESSVRGAPEFQLKIPPNCQRSTSRATMPVLAIGGVAPDRAGECRHAGAAGMAAIGIFLPPGRAPGALGPRAATVALRDAWDSDPLKLASTDE